MSWLPPRCESRVGAAHLRRGTHCQDASGLWCFADADGEPLKALVVSDGHGSARYDRSAVGSRLACNVALKEIESALARCPIGDRSDLEPWREWLANGLPDAVLKGWRSEVLHHGQNHPRADGSPPSTLPYGATLGVLLLTPRWWGYTGLGDWDLVRTGSAGPGELLSEEPSRAGGGEATCSLCMEGAEHLFASRSGLVPIEAGQAPFTLVLSTDGIRKSCGSDADFLNLARHLGALADAEDQGVPSPLAQALDHISSQGSGDDVSVAIARWGQPMVAPRREGRWPPGGPLIVQPLPEVAVQPTGMETPPGDRALDPSEKALTAGDWFGDSVSQGWCPLRWLALPLLALALLAAGAGAMVWLGWQPFPRRAPVAQGPIPELMAVLQKEARKLCTPRPESAGTHLNAALLATINATLFQHNITFQELMNGGKHETFLRTPAKDPTGALIAWSHLHPEPPGVAAPDVSEPSGVCPELRQALKQQWQRVLGIHASPPSKGGEKGAEKTVGDSPNR